MGSLSEFIQNNLRNLKRRCILKSTKFIDMVTKLPEVHAKGLEILEKFCNTNRSFCQSPDSRPVTIKYPAPLKAIPLPYVRVSLMNLNGTKHLKAITH